MWQQQQQHGAAAAAADGDKMDFPPLIETGLAGCKCIVIFSVFIL